MKKLLIAISIFSVLIIACSRKATQVNFILEKQKTFELALEEAKKQNKLVFLDVYTTWCGPCKWMDENVFNDVRVAEKFNKQFVNYKIDGESFDGVNLALKYRIDSYPTYIFIDAEGNARHRIEGMMTAELLLQEADFAKNLTKE
jgi:thioredoxin 1